MAAPGATFFRAESAARRYRSVLAGGRGARHLDWFNGTQRGPVPCRSPGQMPTLSHPLFIFVNGPNCRNQGVAVRRNARGKKPGRAVPSPALPPAVGHCRRRLKPERANEPALAPLPSMVPPLRGARLVTNLDCRRVAGRARQAGRGTNQLVTATHGNAPPITRYYRIRGE